MTDPKHRHMASALLDAAAGTMSDISELGPYESYDPDRQIARAQVRALLAIGHALTDLAETFADDGIGVEVYP
jgi:hypothetical protein